MPEDPSLLLLQQRVGLMPPQDWDLLQLNEGGVHFKWRAYLFWLLFCKIFFKVTVLKVSPIAGFSLEKLSPKDKANSQTEGTFFITPWGGGECTELYVYIYAHPPNCCCSGGCFHTNKFWEKSQRCFSLVLCIYIKKQSFVCFYYFNYCYKRPAIFNMWFWGFLFVFLFWGFVFCVFFWAKKKQTNLLLVFVLLLVRTLNIEVFLKIKDEEK